MKLDVLLKDIPHETIQTGEQDDILFITHDSRKAAKGCLFICLKGSRSDGHAFIAQAHASGAAAVLICDDQAQAQTQTLPGLTVIKTNNTRAAMSLAAASFYGNPAKKLRLIGVTGTNGKTTTTYYIKTLMEAAGRKAGIIGTNGIFTGNGKLEIPFDTATTPDPIELQYIFSEMLALGVQDVVMEVSSHALSLHKMEGLIFKAAVFTNLTQDHLDFYGNMDYYKEAKAKLFAQCEYAVLNADDAYMPAMLPGGNKPYITYGIHNECSFKAVYIKHLPKGFTFDIEINGTNEAFFLPAKGLFNICNSLAAIGTALVLGFSINDIKKGISNIKGVPGRIQPVPNEKDFNVLIDYAHTPDGLVNIINAVRAFTKGKVITLFGCGGDRDKSKRPVMGRIAGELSDYCILTSDNPRSEPPDEIIRQIETGLQKTGTPYDIKTNRRDAIFTGISMLARGDSLIIAGKGHEDYQIVGDETLYFNDYETAIEFLAPVRSFGDRPCV